MLSFSKKRLCPSRFSRPKPMSLKKQYGKLSKRLMLKLLGILLISFFLLVKTWDITKAKRNCVKVRWFQKISFINSFLQKIIAKYVVHKMNLKAGKFLVANLQHCTAGKHSVKVWWKKTVFLPLLINYCKHLAFCEKNWLENNKM